MAAENVYLSLNPRGHWLVKEVSLTLNRFICPYDVRLICRDGVILLHRIILAPLSPSLSKIIAQHAKAQGEDEVIYLILPDIDLQEAISFSQLIYTGEALVSTQSDIERLKDLTKLLKLLPIPVVVVNDKNDRNVENNLKPQLAIETQQGSSGHRGEPSRFFELSSQDMESGFETALPPVHSIRTEDLHNLDVDYKMREKNDVSLNSLLIKEENVTFHLLDDLCQSKSVDNDAEEDRLLESILEFTETVAAESSVAATSNGIKAVKDQSIRKSKKVEVGEMATSAAIDDLICSECGCGSFERQRDLNRHLAEKHKIIDPYLCKICGQRYRRKQRFIDHSSTHEKERKFSCPVCFKKFRTKELCNSHEKSHSSKRGYRCDICGASFRQRNVLHQHKLTVHRERRFNCNTCSKKFSTKQNFEVHMRIHTGEAPFFCNICDSKFRRSHHFKKHVTTLAHLERVERLRQDGAEVDQRLDPGRESRVCQICPNNLTFKSQLHFARHLKSRSHNDYLVSFNQPQHPDGMIPSGSGLVEEIFFEPQDTTRTENVPEAILIDQAEILIFRDDLSVSDLQVI